MTVELLYVYVLSTSKWLQFLYLVALLQCLHDCRHHQVDQHKLSHNNKAGEVDW